MSTHTAGPWKWELNEKHRSAQLMGRNEELRLDYDLTVMDFVRYGMGGAAPRFRTDRAGMNIMKRVEEWGAVVPGREHHADWYKAIDHPDARLIAASPDLLYHSERLLRELDGWAQEALYEAGGVTNTRALQQMMDGLQSAIAKAKGGEA